MINDKSKETAIDAPEDAPHLNSLNVCQRIIILNSNSSTLVSPKPKFSKFYNNIYLSEKTIKSKRPSLFCLKGVYVNIFRQ